MKRAFASLLALTFILVVLVQTCSARLATFDDYVFYSDTKINAHSWSFDLTVKNPEWSSPADGIVLDYHYYDVNDSEPVNYISPVDILIASGVVAANPDKYKFSFLWGDRYVNVSFETVATEINTVITNIGNIHCIARNQESLQMLKNINNGTKIQLSGYLVDIDGWNTTSMLHWNTDVTFGNEDCEILVISDIIPSDVGSGDVMVMMGLLLMVIGIMTAAIVTIHFRQQKRCKIESMKKNKIGKAIRSKKRK